MSWFTYTFQELSPQILYQILALRAEVFVVEQACAYQDLDEKDYDAIHLCAFESNELVAYARILPAGVSYQNAASIGRVLTRKSVRMDGYGIELMNRAIELVSNTFNADVIEISAQCYLIQFYQKFGFETIGKEYLEDNIPHIKMALGIKCKQ